MMHWTALLEELGRWRQAGLRLDVWLRDDDAVEVTPQFQCLVRLVHEFEAPVLLAVIPAFATPALAGRVEGDALLRVCQHGWQHENHAPPDQKRAEFGDHRPIEMMLADLDAGRRRLAGLFPARLESLFVPPWNRIAPALVARLPAAGFDRLSAFRPLETEAGSGLRVINPDIDIIDWKNGRRLRPATDIEYEVVARLQALRRSGCAEPRLGLLLHHLVHGEDAWALMDSVMSVFASHSAVKLADPAQF